MARIVSFSYCEMVQNEVSSGIPKAHIVGPLIVLAVPFIPTTFSFSVSIGISGIDIAEPNKIQYKLLSPSGNIIHDTNEIILPIDRTAPAKLPKMYRGIQLNIDLRNLVLKEEGEYESLIVVNGEKLKGYNLPVVVEHDYSDHKNK